MIVTKRPENHLCRDCACLWAYAPPALSCPKCGSRHIITHPELTSLSIAHIDCDSFYTAVEKRDNPQLANKAVAVGGEKRGVVAAACYFARLYGVKSAMPMFKAKKICPGLIVIKPNMKKYRQAGQKIRHLMQTVTPEVEPISIDEAFLNLAGTAHLHKAYPCQTLIRLVKQIEQTVGISVSVGLSHNKFLAKIASDLEKPKGFSVIGRAETLDFLSDKPVSIIWGVGKATEKKLNRDGFGTVGELRRVERAALVKKYGRMGQHLYDYARGIDRRKIDTYSATKSISSETTFDENIRNADALCDSLWPLCETVSKNLKQKNYAGRSVTVKLKTGYFKQITRSTTLANPTQLAETLFRIARTIVKKEANGTAYRLIGIAVADLESPENADPVDLADPDAQKRARIEKAIDAVRKKLGDQALYKGRGLK